MEFFETVISVLKQDERFFTAEGDFLRNTVYEAAMRMDTALIRILLSNTETKKRFFSDIEGTLVFDKVGFGWIINNRQFLPNSYTRFKNKIGLVDTKGDLISASEDVELVFPFKDCVLEGGQTKDEEKRDEVFFNELLAPDEVDRLLFPKAFCNSVLYTKEGQKVTTGISNTDNLIIKGNNLLALASLLKRYEGNVKCIYIDPPYNTGNDSFRYNDSFKRSSWLAFMNNRLRMAKRLLKTDGVLFVQINYKEMAYLKVLCDEIFGEVNYLNTITVQVATTASYRSINDCPVNVSEYILMYAANKSALRINPIYVSSEYSEDYGSYIKNFEEPWEKWEIVTVDSMIYEQEGVATWQDFRRKHGRDWKRYRLKLKTAFCNANSERIVSLNTMQKPSKEIIDCIELSKKTRNKIFAVGIDRDKPTYIYNGRTLAFYDKKFREIDGVVTPSEVLTNIWTDISFLSLGNEGGVDLPNGKKPEKLIKRILELTTATGDIIMDFFAGTGTTGAVAHKMHRQYILCEQMDYIENLTIARLNGVINGDQGGVSETVDWQGGGSFVFCELAKKNQTFVERIMSAKDDNMLAIIWQDMKATGYICHYINPSDIDSNSKEFTSLSFDDKKRLLIELLDKNMLYVNYCDMEDAENCLSEADKAFTEGFYKGV